MLAEVDMDEEESESSDNDENVHLLGPYYKLTTKGAIVPLVGSVTNAYSEENSHVALKKVMAAKENKVRGVRAQSGEVHECEPGRVPVRLLPEDPSAAGSGGGDSA